jgi:hypothetical protein
MPPKRQLNFNRLHIVIFQKLKFFITTGVETLITTKFCMVLLSSSRSTYSFHRNCPDFITLRAPSDLYYSQAGRYAICGNGKRLPPAH